MKMDRDELTARLGEADRALVLLRWATHDLRAAGRAALERREDDESRWILQRPPVRRDRTVQVILRV